MANHLGCNILLGGEIELLMVEVISNSFLLLLAEKFCIITSLIADLTPLRRGKIFLKVFKRGGVGYLGSPNKMNYKTFVKIAGVLGLLLVVGFFAYRVGFFTGQKSILVKPPSFVLNAENGKPVDVDFSVFWETWQQVEQKFLNQDKINRQQMVYGAIKGMLSALGDPYTNFFDPKEAASFEEELSGKYEGVGMYVGSKDDQLTVISPLKGSPAEKAGIMPQDKIIKINETYSIDISVEEAVKLIKGASGTEVKISILRDKWTEPKEFILKRQMITIPTLELEMVGEKKDIAWLRIYQFNQILPEEMGKAAEQMLDAKATKIIVDLRNNPGGYLEVAQAMAGWFLEKGQVVVWQDSGKDKIEYKSNGPSTFVKYSVVVIINQGSASASEILAGALRDQRKAKLVGEKSFGKGSVQEQVLLSDKSSMKVTVAKWLTPQGLNIDKDGLTPDYDVKMEIPGDIIDPSQAVNKDNDAQLQKAVEVIDNLR